MRIGTYYEPKDLSDAYENLVNTKGAVIMAGGMFLRLQKRHFPMMIDLSMLGLEGVTEKEGRIEIGAMTCLRDIEKSEKVPAALIEAMRQVGGVSLRNMATIGGSVMGKYPFSDVITPLLALDATLHFYKEGEMRLATFLEGNHPKQDILTNVTFNKPVSSAFKTFKKVYVDFSLLNVVVAKLEEGAYKISIGARPGHAKHIDVQSLKDVKHIISAFEFGDNIRASGAYRNALAQAFLEDLREEEPLWK